MSGPYIGLHGEGDGKVTFPVSSGERLQQAKREIRQRAMSQFEEEQRQMCLKAGAIFREGDQVILSGYKVYSKGCFEWEQIPIGTPGVIVLLYGELDGVPIYLVDFTKSIREIGNKSIPENILKKGE